MIQIASISHQQISHIGVMEKGSKVVITRIKQSQACTYNSSVFAYYSFNKAIKLRNEKKEALKNYRSLNYDGSIMC